MYPRGYGGPSFSPLTSGPPLSAPRLQFAVGLFFGALMNEIYLRRLSRMHLAPGSGTATPEQLATVQKELHALGYALSAELLTCLGTYSRDELATTVRQLMKIVRQLVGAHRNLQPLFPGFPFQTVSSSEARLLLNANYHYRTHRRLPSAVNAASRRPLDEQPTYRLISRGSMAEFEDILTQLAGSSTALSAQDRNDLEWFLRRYRADAFRLLPKQLPCKEVVAVVCAQLMRHAAGDERLLQFLSEHVRTATDVLRLAAALSDGDVSLAAPTRFSPFSRPQRRLLMLLLEQCGAIDEDLFRWGERWKRLGERLHPGEFLSRYPRAAAAFQHLRNGQAPSSFNAAIERALAASDVPGAALFLESRPGEFARRLDVMLRRTQSTGDVVSRFDSIAQRVSTPVLLQLLAHFRARSEIAGRLRVFMPKGQTAKAFAIPDRRSWIAEEVCGRIVETCERALVSRFSTLPPLGRCHLDSALARYPVPLAQRSASKALRTLARGSRPPLPDSRFIRLFLWWMNGRSRVDIDLSVALMDSDYHHLATVSYYNLRTWGAYHSGDIVDAPQGAAEFIDLDLPLLRARAVRFVVMCITSYSGQAYCELPECFSGWMARRDLNSGEPFEARTVIDRVDLASDSTFGIPLILDLQRREVVWADLALRSHPIRLNNVHSNMSRVSLLLRSAIEMIRPDLHTLLSLHVKARGQPAAQPDETGVRRFGVVAGCHLTPFDLDTIRAEYLV